MLKIENTEVIGWKMAIRGMRNPMNSWANSDSIVTESQVILGEGDADLMERLRNAGTDHRKFMRMITVYADITGPLYWWKEFDTYKVGTVANSCSTMHKIADKEFTWDDFSIEHVYEDAKFVTEKAQDLRYPSRVFHSLLQCLNLARDAYLETKDKKYWWTMIQMLPTSYNQRRTIMLNYEVLANMYKSRKNHKLDEWHTFCAWIRSLPYSWLITGELDVQEDRNEKA